MTMSDAYRHIALLSLNMAFSACPYATHGHLIDVCFSRSSDVHVTGMHKPVSQCLANAKTVKVLAQTAISNQEGY